MTTIKKCVMDALENLTGDEYKKFCNALVDRPGDRRVEENKVRRKDYFDVTNVLVSTFSEDGTPAVVIELLEKIGCSDEAKDLDDRIAEPLPKSSASKDKHFVSKHWVRLIEYVTNVDAILNRLLEKKVIHDGIYEEILDAKGNQEKMTKIYKLVLKSGNRAKDIFLEILKEQEPLVVGELENFPIQEEHFVIKHGTEVIESVTDINPILNSLLQKKVIQDDDYDEIRDTRGHQEKMTKIYGLVLRSGIRAKEIFFEILKEQEPALVEDLENIA
ncbi:apoptosis-associated speck-like protein containing a CARD [Syngnathus typhle]|uniref:apoptosis-associated speck-like protein containing a CARD n=1 Tax=Syngnathus typhle TaxID=161592 RepID=UPI002A6A090B|nr:apoptosis-associated speck-like protein containing a CARD [Syngnathus typhle]